MTWVLLLFFSGTAVPIKVEGYDTEQACRAAGDVVGKNLKTPWRASWHICFPGPLREAIK